MATLLLTRNSHREVLEFHCGSGRGSSCACEDFSLWRFVEDERPQTEETCMLAIFISPVFVLLQILEEIESYTSGSSRGH